MKKIVLKKTGSPFKSFKISEHILPEPQGREVRIRVEVSGLNFADVMARQGLYPEAPKLPCVLGFEVVGIIEEVGLNADGFKAGDRVVAFTRFGGYASHVIANVDGISRISNSMDASVAAALATQYSTAWYATEELAHLREGDHVLIQAAAGGVGNALVQIAKRRGCLIYGTAGSDSKLTVLKDYGVDYPINYRTGDFVAEVKKISGSRGLDFVFDSIGGQSFNKGLRLLRPGGRIITFGLAQVVGKENKLIRVLKTLLGFGLLSPISLLKNSQGVIGINLLKIAETNPEMLQKCMQAVIDLTERNELQPLAGKVFSYDQVSEAHEFLENRESIGKLVLRWTDSM